MRVDSKIAGYTADKDNYRYRLKEIRLVYEAWIEMVDKILDELKVENDTDESKTIKVKALKTELTKVFKDNEMEVEVKVVECVAEFEASKPMSETKRN